MSKECLLAAECVRAVFDGKLDMRIYFSVFKIDPAKGYGSSQRRVETFSFAIQKFYPELGDPLSVRVYAHRNEVKMHSSNDLFAQYSPGVGLIATYNDTDPKFAEVFLWAVDVVTNRKLINDEYFINGYSP